MKRVRRLIRGTRNRKTRKELATDAVLTARFRTRTVRLLLILAAEDYREPTPQPVKRVAPPEPEPVKPKRKRVAKPKAGESPGDALGVEAKPKRTRAPKAG